MEEAEKVELKEALKELLLTMEMQENRESGAFHITQEVALHLWNKAKARANAALKL